MRYNFILVITFLFTQPTFGQEVEIESFILSYCREHQFNGTLLVQKDSVKLYHKSFGIADRRFDTLITNETIFKVASITKAFTAVLILQLYEEGKIALNSTINTYLPEYRGEAGSKVTIHQLLNHTSGMRQIDTISSLSNAFQYGLGYLQKPHTSDQLLKQFEQDPLINEPGIKWDYNNYEYMVLGKIIEEHYDMSYEEVLKEKILLPLGMVSSGLLRERDIVKNLASTYFIATEPGILINDIPIFIENWYSAGAMYSSTIDILKFSNALFGLSLINQDTLELMLTPELEEYGYGVWVREFEDNMVMERYGRIMGANAVWMQFLDKNITIIITSNTNLTDLGDFAINIGKELLD